MDVKARLKNWARWCREYPQFSHCMSIEHQYRSPQCWDAPEPRGEPVDLLDGHRVEIAVRGLLPVYRDALRLFHVKRWPLHAIRRKLKATDAEILVNLAEISVIRVLSSADESRTVRPDNLSKAPNRVHIAA